MTTNTHLYKNFSNGTAISGRQSVREVGVSLTLCIFPAGS